MVKDPQLLCNALRLYSTINAENCLGQHLFHEYPAKYIQMWISYFSEKKHTLIISSRQRLSSHPQMHMYERVHSNVIPFQSMPPKAAFPLAKWFFQPCLVRHVAAAFYPTFHFEGRVVEASPKNAQCANKLNTNDEDICVVVLEEFG